MSLREHVNIEDLLRLRHGELNGAELARVAAHLAHCSTCAAMAKEMFSDDAVVLELDRHQTASAFVPKKFYLVAAMIALVVAAAALLVLRERRRADGTVIRSLAVMPMRNDTKSNADDFLSVALSDALTNQLQQMPAVLVPPMSAVLGAQADGATPAVDALINGHFGTAGNLIRVTLELNDVRSGRAVWSRSIEGPRANLAEVIDRASKIALSELSRKSGEHTTSGGSQPHSDSHEAFEEYLKARALQDSLVPAECARQIAYLSRAIEIDPNFAAAHAELAIALSLAQTRDLLHDSDAVARAESHAREAVRLDPKLSVAHLALGRAIVRIPGHFYEAMREEAAALQLNANNVPAISMLGSYFALSGDLERTRALSRYLVRLDPRSNEARTRGYWFVDLADANDAIAAASDALSARSTELAGLDITANAYIFRGDLVRARQYASRAAALAPGSYLGRSLTAMIAASAHDATATRIALQSFEKDATTTHWAAMRQALCYARIGDREKAIFWMKQATDHGNIAWYRWRNDRWMQPLRNDPEFEAMLRPMHENLETVRGQMIEAYRRISK